MGNGMDKVLPGLYVGNLRGASSKTLLDENSITHVLAIFDNAQPVNNGRVYLCIKAKDVQSQDLTQFFSQCNDFIHNARINNGAVLVHCVAGMSRSVTITTAYIMSVTSLGWREALNAVRGARRTANPNFGFQRQLLGFFHDHLPQEKARMTREWPACSYDDQAECERLIAAHRQWVLHGDVPDDLDDEIDDENTYPLAHNAYTNKRAGAVLEDTVAKDIDGMVAKGDGNQGVDDTNVCTAAKTDITSTSDNTGLAVGSLKISDEKEGITANATYCCECGKKGNYEVEDASSKSAGMCEECARKEKEEMAIVASAPEVPRDEPVTSLNGAASNEPIRTGLIKSESSRNETERNLNTKDDSEELVTSLFSENSRKKERKVNFDEEVDISKVEKIDSKMKEQCLTGGPAVENEKPVPIESVLTSKSDSHAYQINANHDIAQNSDSLVDEMFTASKM